MELIFKDDKKRKISKIEEITFATKTSGLYIIKISARAKSEKQLGSTDDEELTVQIDDKVFSKLGSDSKNVLDSPASINGGELHNLLKTVYFLTNLSDEKHKIILKTDNPPNTATFETLEVYTLGSRDKITLEPKLQAEDGDRREWVTFALDNMALNSLTVDLNLKRRFVDSDDVKIIVDGEIKRNNRSILHKLWYFAASLLIGETQTETFNINLITGLHYIEFWADRMPILNKITFYGLKADNSNINELSPEEIIKEKIKSEAEKAGLDPELILRLVERESTFNPKAISPVGAKGLFQLMDQTIEQIGNLGFEINDPYDIGQNIQGGLIYFKWLYDRYTGDPEHLEKTLAAWNWGLNKFPKEGSLDYRSMPDETKNFIRFILNK